MSAPERMHAFLFTDIAGSTSLWERFPVAMEHAYERHDSIMRDAAATHGGVVYKVIGDAFQVAFPTPFAAVAAAVDAQLALNAESWPLPVPLLVRMALHSVDISPDRSGDFRSPSLNRLGRLLGAGHGGQILVSEALADAVQDQMPADCTLRSLGRRRLRDFPDPELIVQIDHPRLAGDFAPLLTADERRFNLPIPPNEIIGREADLTQIGHLFERGGRLVTLVGPGGSGKTRLALELGSRLRDRWSDGVVFVELAAISDPALVPAAIADALELRSDGQQSPLETLAAWLASREILLILDNLEQVIDCARAIARLLAAAPGLRVLATSREALHIRAERQYPVELLATPGPEHDGDVSAIGSFPSVRLFVERASAVTPLFRLDANNASAIAEICRQLDGLPLAIELAAAQIGSLTPTALRSRLTDRLTLLIGGARDLPDRQQTLRATIAWSYDLLPRDDRARFRRLAVFAGGFDLAAALAVTNNSGPERLRNDLETLVGKHLLNRYTRQEQVRYVMLESVREFAQETLQAAAEDHDARRLHALWYHEWIVNNPDAHNHDGLEQTDIEHANLRSAIAWADEHSEHVMHLELAVALARFWQFRGYVSEGRTYLERALQGTPELHSQARQAALAEAGTLANANGDYVAARRSFEAALALAEERNDLAAIAAILNSIGGVLLALGDSVSAEGFFVQSLEIAERTGDRKRAMIARSNIGAIAHYRADFDTARRFYEVALMDARELADTFNIALTTGNLLILLAPLPEARDEAIAFGEEGLRSYDELGDHQGKGYVLDGLGTVAEAAGDAQTARRYYEQSLAQFRAADDPGGIAMATMGLGSVAALVGNRNAAATLFREVLVSFVSLDERDSVASTLDALAEIAVAEGDHTAAALLFGHSEQIRSELDVSAPQQSAGRLTEARSAVEKTLGAAQFSAMLTKGASLSFDQAVEIALSLRVEVDTAELA